MKSRKEKAKWEQGGKYSQYLAMHSASMNGKLCELLFSDDIYIYFELM